MARVTRRDLKKEEIWRRRLEAQAGSGLSVRVWCRQHDTRESAFYWWRAQLARRDAKAPTFAPVRVVADPAAIAAGRIEIVLPGDCRVHVTGPVDRRALGEVFAALADHALAAGRPGC
jgi:hypothetical protein